MITLIRDPQWIQQFLNRVLPQPEQVSDWMDRNGPIANADLCQIAGLDTLKASKQLKRWVDQGLLVPDTGRGKRNMVYRKPVLDGSATEGLDLLSQAPENKPGAD
ncbi:hypothetical protein [Roseateles sp. BYS96W]|uniref:MarR family transcriptional regulator n=1 Tax=Pelomonas nitida TaxID=3299027 RepID=A0ABW7G657_9BURK